MADKIQLILENLIPELDELVKKGIFLKKDVKKIIKKRRSHEYSFEKKDVNISDYYKAIQYETILNQRLNENKKKLNLKKLDYYDFHFIRRIIFLYKKCLMKFEKEKIYMDFFNFLIKNKCFNILNKEIGKVLTKFPKKIIFWKIAVYNEFENNLNFFGARNLMQKCLRLNEENLESFLEYFIFEIIFAQKIGERKSILKGKINNDEKENKLKLFDEEKLIDKNLNEIKENNNEINNENEDEILNLKIPEIIFDEICKKMEGKNIIEKNKFLLKLFENFIKFTNNNKFINSKFLENKIVQTIINLNKNDYLNILIKIKKIKLNNNFLFENVINEFQSLLNDKNNENYFNFIVYKIHKIIKKNENNDENIFFEKLKNFISLDNLINNYNKFNNIKILFTLFNDFSITENYFDIKKLKEIFENIFKKIIENNETNLLNEIFNILNLIREEDKNLFEFFDNNIKFNKNNNNKFLEKFFFEYCKIISNEIQFYLNSQDLKKYFKLLINKIKMLDLNFNIYNSLYYNYLNLLINKIFELNDIQSYNKYYQNSIDYLKKHMNKNLINLNYLINQIKQTNNFTNEQINFINNL